MSDKDLQNRFEQALRRELGMAGDAGVPGTSIVNVAAPSVSVSPRVEAVLPALPQPLEVADVDRWAGAWRYRMEVKRDSSGYIQAAEMLPTRFVTAEEIQNERR